MSDVLMSDSVKMLAEALVKCQQQLKVAVKDSTNPFFKSKYADLGSVWDACREALASNGLSVVQLPGYSDGAARLTTILLHTSGQWIQGTAGAPLPNKLSKDGKELPPDAQSVGSALSYLRRYALAAAIGVVTEDDDGNAATRKAGGAHPQAVAGTKAPASAAPPAGVSEDGEVLGPTRDTPWEGPGPTHGKTVRDWSIAYLRMADDGTVKVPDEWLLVIRQELKARSFKKQLAQ